jgi:hypothetical protein
MPIPVVDFNKSIERKKLIYNEGKSSIFDRLFTWFIGLTVIVVIVGILLNNGFENAIPLIGITPVITIWMLANLLLMDALVKIPGDDINSNRKYILSSFNELFDNLEIKDSGGNIIRDIKYSTNSKYNTNCRVITILFNDKDVYLNITSIIKYSSVSPFSGWFNYLKCKQVAWVFILKQDHMLSK